MVSTSPRLRDSLDYEEPDSFDPRLSSGFQSMSIGSDEEFAHPEPDYRPRSRGSDPLTRKKKRQRQTQALFGSLADKEFQYETVADGDSFRLIELYPGVGTEAILCRLFYQSYKEPEHDYTCLSYCWQTNVRVSVSYIHHS